jgi:hypothetical protein
MARNLGVQFLAAVYHLMNREDRPELIFTDHPPQEP